MSKAKEFIKQYEELVRRTGVMIDYAPEHRAYSIVSADPAPPLCYSIACDCHQCSGRLNVIKDCINGLTY